MKKYVLPALILALTLALAACRMSPPAETEPSTETQGTTAATTPTILPDPTIETNIPDPSVDTSMPTEYDTIDNENNPIG